jgi:hypothetical protein
MLYMANKASIMLLGEQKTYILNTLLDHKAWSAVTKDFRVPTSAWLNLVERWFGLIIARAIRRGSFDSVARLEQAITRFLANWNKNAKPFRWTKSAHQIKRSIRNAAFIYETPH